MGSIAAAGDLYYTCNCCVADPVRAQSVRAMRAVDLSRYKSSIATHNNVPGIAKGESMRRNAEHRNA